MISSLPQLSAGAAAAQIVLQSPPFGTLQPWLGLQTKASLETPLVVKEGTENLMFHQATVSPALPTVRPIEH